MDIKQIDKEYIAGTYARFPVQLACGKGALIKDENGKEYIDLGTGIAVNTFGYADDEWIAAVTAQLRKPAYLKSLLFGAVRAARENAL